MNTIPDTAAATAAHVTMHYYTIYYSMLMQVSALRQMAP